jgi:hypothetical protein
MYICGISDTNIVVFKKPESMEAILRAEGKYPVRDVIVSTQLKWLSENVAKEVPSFAIE